MKPKSRVSRSHWLNGYLGGWAVMALSTRQAAANIRLSINQVPKVWEDGHVSLGDLWRLYTQYPYMPRLRDRRVLEEGLTQMPLLWEQDGFALAVSYDANEGRYTGLWTRPSEEGPAPAPPDGLLLVRPDVAVAQVETEPHTDDAEPGSESHPQPGPAPPPPPAEHQRDKRFYGVKTLNADSIARDFKDVADEVIAHIRADDTDLTVRIEIEATNSSGFDENKARVIKENTRTLKFDDAGFELE